MARMRVCGRCGTELGVFAPEGLCIACMLAAGLAPEEDEYDAHLAEGWEQYPDGKAAEPEPRPHASRFGDFELFEEIGRGGMGVVYRARQVSLNRVVALKMIQAQRLASPAHVQRFRLEAETAANLQHPNIVAIHQVGEDSGQHFFSMDYVAGPSLAQVIADRGSPPWDFKWVARCLQAIAQAVHYAHQRGILHRDLKPSNVLVDGNAVPRVTDFGLAKRLEGASTLTLTGEVLGSPSYMAPEQITGSPRQITVAADTYSLGCILYELLTARAPFSGATPADTLRHVLHTEATPPSAANPAAPKDLETICLKCLEKEPSRRYATALEVADELGRFLRDEPILARRASPIEKAWRWARRNTAVAGLSALALILFLCVAVGSPLAVWNIQRAREAAESRAYASDMNLAQQALAANNIGRAERLLQRYWPAENLTGFAGPDSPGRLGWEWRYLWRQCQSDVLYTLCRQSNSISSLAVSHDGQWLAVGEKSHGGLTIWDLPSRRQIARLPAGENAVHVAFSPRQRLLAFTVESGDMRSSNHNNQVCLWDGQTQSIVARIPVGYWCRGLAFSGDGRTLITSTLPPDNRFTLWRLPEGTPLGKYPALRTPSSGVRFAAAPDLRRAVHVVKERLRVVDLSTGREAWSAALAGEEVSTVAFSADGTLLASGVSGGEPVIRLWDAETGKPVGELKGHAAYVTDVCFWPDGKTLASASADQTIRLWNLEQSRVLQVLHGHRQEVWRLALLPDNRTLVSGCKDGSVYVWDTASPSIARGVFTLPVTVRAWCFSSDSQSVFTFDREGRITRWHGTTFQHAEPLLELGSGVREGCFSADGRWFAGGFSTGSVRVWDLSGRSLVRELNVASGTVRPLAFLPQGCRLSLKVEDTDHYQEWDVTTEQQLRSWRGARSGTLAAFSPDAQWAFTMGRAHATSLRHLDSGREPELGLASIQAWNGAFSPDGKHFAIASSLGFCRVWETRRFEKVATLSGFLHGAHSVAFSPDNRRLAAGSNAKEAVKLWDLASRQELLTLEGRGSMFNSCAFSQDGNVLGALNSAGGLHLWRAPGWEEIATAEARHSAAADAR